MFSLIPVDHDPFAGPPFKLIPVDHDPFAVGPGAQPADPAMAGAGTAAPQLVPVDHDPFAVARTDALPHIIVHPKSPNAPPDNSAGADGPDDWFVPTADGYPDDWFVPAPAAAPAQSGPGAQSNAAVPPVSNPPTVRPDPSAAFWSLVPASRVGAMAWNPPIFPGDSTTFPPGGPTTPASPGWPATGIPSIRTSGGLYDGLAQLAPANPYPEYALPFGGLLNPPAAAVPSSPSTGSVLPTAQPQSADPQPVSPTGRRPITDYSTGEIAADAAKSFGVGVGRFGIQVAGFPGDVRQALARGAQRAADYLAPGYAPNAGSIVSDYLASYPLLGGPTSSQLRSAVELYTGPFYQPKTIVGDYAQTAGEFVPGALLMPEGSLAANALRYGILPAFSSETAGQLTKGTAAEPWARAAGGVLGTAANTWRALPRIQSAPAVAKPLAPPVFDPIAQLRLNVEAGRAGEAALGIPANAPKPSIRIPGSGKIRFPDRLTSTRLEEVKNARYQALTRQIRDYLAYAQANELIFILRVRPGIKYSGPLQDLIDAGQIIPSPIAGLLK